jgi:hypothetical protein
VQGKRHGRHRAQKLPDARLHVLVGPYCCQPNMDIDAAASDKFPKKRSSPCVFASDPLSLTLSSSIPFKHHAPVSFLPADPA